MKQIPLNSGVFVLCALLAISGCARKKETLPLSSDTIMTPYQDLDSTTLFFYEGGIRRWKLEADHMRKPLFDTGSMIVTPVTLTYYDSLGNISTRVLSDSGSTTAALASFTVWGNVFIRNKDSLIVKTEKLWWVKERRKVESNTFVQIETPKGDVLRGKGLDAVEDFSRFTFKSQVSGKFPDFKRRMDENDDKMF
jgi:LPS export ABC transporter protein LptC